MESGLVDTAARIDQPDERRINGITVGRVVKNCDETNSGRVQVRLPWLPDFEPWARLALLDRGVYFIPRVDDEVLVMSNRGDVTELYVVGCLWNGKDKPPAQGQDDPKSKRMIQSPLGHKIMFDDDARTVTITSADKRRITLGQDKVEVALDDKSTSAMTISKDGTMTLTASSKLRLVAPELEIVAGTFDPQSNQSSPSGKCTINGIQINIG
jgi:uncharacterized protein involved in type VI secretion and phage assembly